MTNERPSSEVEKQPSPARVTYAVANLMKLGGIAVVIHEVFLVQNLRPLAMGVAALMFGGAQGLRDILDAILGPK